MRTLSQSLNRALDVLYAAAEKPVSINDVAELLNVHPTTASRTLQTLQSRRFMKQNRDGKYQLGSGIVWLANCAQEQMDLREIAAPLLKKLSQETSETIHLAALENERVVYIDKIDSKHSVRIYSRTGALARTHCSAVAKAIVAFSASQLQDALIAQCDFHGFTPHTIRDEFQLREEFQRTIERGYALDIEERESGIQWIAAPVFNSSGQPFAAIGISTLTSRVSKEDLLGFEPNLRSITVELSELMGYTPKS